MTDSKTTHITNDITFRGELAVDDKLIIDGKVEGSIKAGDKIEIEQSAEVKADITVKSLILKGKLQGNVIASDLVHITHTGKLQGDIECKSLQIDKGGNHKGSTVMK